LAPEGVIEKELERLRARQAKRVMRRMGPLLDEYDGLPNDVRGWIKQQAPGFIREMNKLQRAVEGNDGG
jgi:hypothetical protein